LKVSELDFERDGASKQPTLFADTPNFFDQRCCQCLSVGQRGDVFSKGILSTHGLTLSVRLNLPVVDTPRQIEPILSRATEPGCHLIKGEDCQIGAGEDTKSMHPGCRRRTN